MRTLFLRIKGLAGAWQEAPRKVSGKNMKDYPVLEDAWLCIEGPLIHSFGSMKDLDKDFMASCDEWVDLKGQWILPSFIDSHTHIVFAETREKEFVDRIHGLSYEEIAKRGGGILNSADKLRASSEEELFSSALERVDEIVRLGTGAVEIKSGYGLSIDSEIKMLRAIKSLEDYSPIPIRATFLGAHAIPREFKENRQGYIRQITDEMLPIIAEERLADFIDVFCDRGFYTQEETEQILEAGARFGLRPKIHANELDYTGGIQAGVKYNALSVDHLECTGDEEIQILLNSETMPTLLPSTAFFLSIENPPARKMIDAGLAVALASDYNPGSSPSGRMPFVWSLACIKLKMDPEEALAASTINGAYALGLEDQLGSITPGKRANFIITRQAPSLAYFPYAFGTDWIDSVWADGFPYNGMD
jgi:imidazolonepropionase